MRLSTSSFETEMNGKGWFKTFVYAIFLTVLILAGLEAYWRDRGHRPSVVDDKNLWAYHRSRVYKNGQKTIVLLGASRMQVNISIPVLADRFPDHEIVQLAITGTHPMSSLRDLSNDAEFNGIVICSIVASGLEPRHWDHQKEYVDHYRKNAGWNNQLNSNISYFLQNHLVIMDPYVKLKPLLMHYFKHGELPSPKYVVTHHDRSRDADYTMLDIEKHRILRLKTLSNYFSKYQPYAPEVWLRDAMGIESWIKKIQARGGQVLFIRFPTSEHHWIMEEKYYPKKLYWDRFSAMTSANTIHFQDVTTLKNFYLPDMSHLDARDKVRFTNAFANELIDSKALNPYNQASSDPHPLDLSAISIISTHS